MTHTHPAPGPGAAGWRLRQRGPALRRETHFGRVMTCFADRPPQFHALMQAALSRNPDAPALVSAEEGTFSHAALRTRAARVARGLAELGVARGDRVAILLGNRFAFVETWLACLRLGAVLVPLNPRWQAREIAWSVNDSGARALVFERDLAPGLPAPADIPDCRALIPTADDAPLFPDAPADGPETPGGEEDCAVILYTSGTTGTPKGAMLTHLNLVHTALHFGHAMGLGPSDRTMLAVPASHVTGLMANIGAVLGAGGAVLVLREFKAAAMLDLAARHGMTHTVMVPAMYNLILRDPAFARTDLSAWRIGGYGGASMPEPTIAALAERLPRLGLVNAYGATETSSPATLLPPEETARHGWSVGHPLHCAEIAVMDAEGHERPAGESGEIWIAGPMVVPGYWNNPEATAREFVGGFWKSGDVGRMDREGRVAVMDRLKDMINRGGYKVYSAEVENVLAAAPQVMEVAVTGFPCEVLGERVRAHVVLAEGAGDPAAAEAALRAHAARELADYKRPDAWDFLAAPLPRNANGKVLKSVLRASADAP